MILMIEIQEDRPVGFNHTGIVITLKQRGADEATPLELMHAKKIIDLLDQGIPGVGQAMGCTAAFTTSGDPANS